METHAITINKQFVANFAIKFARKAIPFPFEEHYEAVVVVIEAPGVTWAGIFRKFGDTDGYEIFNCPNPDFLCVRAGEHVSVVNVTRAEGYAEEQFDHIRQIVAVPELSMLLLASRTDITAVGASGVLWKSERLAADDLSIISVDVLNRSALIRIFDPAEGVFADAQYGLG